MGRVLRSCDLWYIRLPNPAAPSIILLICVLMAMASIMQVPGSNPTPVICYLQIAEIDYDGSAPQNQTLIITTIWC